VAVRLVHSRSPSLAEPEKAPPLAPIEPLFVGFDPLKALVFTAVFNGIAAAPLVFLIARLARNQEVMGRYWSGVLSSVLVWLTFGGLGAAAPGLCFSLAKGG